MSENDAGAVLVDLLLTSVPERQRAPAGPANGGVVYYHPKGGQRSIILSEAVADAEDWRAMVPQLVENSLELLQPGTYSVHVVATGKLTASDQYRAGTFKIAPPTEDFTGNIPLGGDTTHTNIALRGDLAALRLSDTRSNAELVQIILVQARFNLEMLRQQHAQQMDVAKHQADEWNEITRARQDLQNSYTEADKVDEEWARTKMRILEKAPGQALELAQTVSGFLKDSKDDKREAS